MALKILRVFLNLFDGEAGAEGAGAAAEAAQGADGTGRVIYGKQAAEAAQTDEPPAEESPAEAEEVNPEKEYKELVRTKYKEQYEADLQKKINRRFKATEERLAKADEALKIVAKKYGADARDIDSLLAKINDDDSYIENAAYERGMTADQYREFDSIQQKANAYEEIQRQNAERQQIREKAEKWRTEAEALKEKYGEFDLEECLNDPSFMAALESGAPMEFAFHGKYHDRLMSDALKFTATRTEKGVVDNIRAKGMRPSENGSSTSNAGFVHKADPSKLTLKDFDEIAKRVARGERISF